MLRLSLLVAALLALAVATLVAQAPVTGWVVDQNKKPIPNVNVQSSGIERPVQTGNDGAFAAQPMAEGGITLHFSHAGYIPRSVRVAAGDTAVTIILTEQIYPMQGITVTAGQAVEGRSPVPFEDLSRAEIARDYDLGEVPAVLELTPNLYSYSDAGGGLGYSYFSIRGFDARRIPVYINGVPLNDPEDHALYFIDLPDLAANADNIQVQRGVGNSLYGDAAFGGAVNIMTSTLAHDRQFVGQFGYGGFFHNGDQIGLMRKSSFAFSTGLLDNGWALSGRWINQFSDGYRKNSWYDGTAYYLSVGRVDPKMITTVNLYAGPMRTHASWWGITREEMHQDRRLNYYTYTNETDNFNQPHLELHNLYTLSPELSLNNTLYFIRGKGFYEEYLYGERLYDYNLSVDTGQYSDLVRRKWVNKWQGGLNSQIVYETHGTKSALGVSYYHFESDHWGEVQWGAALTPTLISAEHPYKYFEHFGKYNHASLFGSHNRTIGERLTLSGNLQISYLLIDVNRTAMGVYDAKIFDLDWLFLSPRIGLNYAISDQVSSYASFSIASHEPNDDMILDADDPNAEPRLDIKDASTIPITYGDPLVKAERVYDYEGGVKCATAGATVGLNLFWMEYRHEIVPDGRLTDDGKPTYGNAERSIHRGVEISWSAAPLPKLKITGNYSLNDNWIKKYDQYLDDGTVISRRDVMVPAFPVWLGNLAVQYDHDPVNLVYRLRGVGRQFPYYDGQYAYTGDGKPSDVSVAPYAVSSVKLSFDLGRFLGASVSVDGRVDNLFDQKYETFGAYYGGYYYYWPAAERSWFMNIKLAIT